MLHLKTRGVALCFGALFLLLTAPAESNACCFLDGLFSRCFGCGGAPQATYGAAYAAPAYAPTCAAPCSPCVPQTCSYVPQTCYRTVYQPVAVTACQAQTCYDPCTGCPVTSYQPVTRVAYQAQLIPYTTYRLVYSNPCTPSASYGGCAPCGAGNGYSAAGAVIGSGCGSSCAPASSATTEPYTSPAPTYSTPQPSLPPAYTAPAQPSNGTSALPQTFAPSTPPNASPTLGNPAPDSLTNPAPQSIQNPNPASGTLVPTPDRGTRRELTPIPRLTDPENRTTLLPVRQAVRYQLISRPPQRSASEASVLDNSGWHASGE